MNILDWLKLIFYTFIMIVLKAIYVVFEFIMYFGGITLLILYKND